MEARDGGRRHHRAGLTQHVEIGEDLVRTHVVIGAAKALGEEDRGAGACNVCSKSSDDGQPRAGQDLRRPRDRRFERSRLPVYPGVNHDSSLSARGAVRPAGRPRLKFRSLLEHSDSKLNALACVRMIYFARSARRRQLTPAPDICF